MPPIPTDPTCLTVYAVLSVLVHLASKAGLIDRLLSLVLPTATPGQPAPPTPAVGHGGLLVTGARDVVQFLRDHRELADELRQLAQQYVQQAPTPPTTPPKS